MSEIRILLIEDNCILRESIVHFLNEQEDMKVISLLSYADTPSYLKKLDLFPDIILLNFGTQYDINLEYMELINKSSSSTRIIATDVDPIQMDIIEFIQYGGSGFILKNATQDTYIQTVRKVAIGQKLLPEDLLETLFKQIEKFMPKNGSINSSHSVRLTVREREVIRLIQQGMCNSDIAQHLYISIHTVKSHVQNILGKLGLKSRLELAAYTNSNHVQNGKVSNLPLDN
ncbi:MAG: response regulator transcription factor [bacterium]